MKPFKYFIFFLLIIFGISKSHAQMYRFSNTNPFWKGEVKLTDGEIIEGLIQVPYKSSQRRVAYKIDEDADRQILKAEDVDAIYLTSSTGYQYLLDRKSTRLNSSHVAISYAVFCLKKKPNTRLQQEDI